MSLVQTTAHSLDGGIKILVLHYDPNPAADPPTALGVAGTAAD